MGKSIKEILKRGRGRPATGRDPAVTVRLSPNSISAIDSRANREKVTRAEVIRHLVEAALRDKATVSNKLDEALDESFPASDPVALGHNDHVGQPKQKRKKDGGWPKGAVGVKEKAPR